MSHLSLYPYFWEYKNKRSDRDATYHIHAFFTKVIKKKMNKSFYLDEDKISSDYISDNSV